MSRQELARVLAGIEEAREAFPFDTSLIPEEMLTGISASLDCAAAMARLQAVSEGTSRRDLSDDELREVVGYEDEEGNDYDE